MGCGTGLERAQQAITMQKRFTMHCFVLSLQINELAHLAMLWCAEGGW